MIFADTVGILQTIKDSVPATWGTTVLPPTRELSQTDGAGLYACRCGANAALCQWRDTLEPNATWVECTNPDCGMMTDSYHHKDAEEAKAEVIRRWNRVMQP